MGHCRSVASAIGVCGTVAGWAIFAALQRAGAAGIPVSSIVEWWADEDQADGLTAYITQQAFPGANLVERCVTVCVLVRGSVISGLLQ